MKTLRSYYIDIRIVKELEKVNASALINKLLAKYFDIQLEKEMKA